MVNTGIAGTSSNGYRNVIGLPRRGEYRCQANKGRSIASLRIITLFII
jgi:hypothetical protein